MKKYYEKFYLVQENDSLSSIANKYNINPTQILIENQISPKEIRKGKLLIISK